MPKANEELHIMIFPYHACIRTESFALWGSMGFQIMFQNLYLYFDVHNFGTGKTPVVQGYIIKGYWSPCSSTLSFSWRYKIEHRMWYKENTVSSFVRFITISFSFFSKYCLKIYSCICAQKLP